MATVTRTLVKGGDTGRLNRDEVRAVTRAIREGRTEDVHSGRVLQEFRAAMKAKGKKASSRKLTPTAAKS